MPTTKPQTIEEAMCNAANVDASVVCTVEEIDSVASDDNNAAVQINFTTSEYVEGMFICV